MPKQGQIKKNRRREVRQQDVFEFTQRIQPKARPVSEETRVTPKSSAGGTAQGLLEGLGLAGRAVKNISEGYRKLEAEHTEEGKIAAMRGDVLNDDATEAFIEGYEEMNGAGKGYMELQTILNQHQNENSEATLEEFGRSQDMAISQFFQGRTDAFTRGALPGAISLQRENQRMFLGKKNEEFEANKLVTTRRYADANITKIFKSEPDNLSQAIRRDLSNTQYLAEKDGMNMNKSAISQQYISLMGKRAVAAGDPSLMEFTAERDVSGHRLIDTPEVATQVEKILNAAERERDNSITERKAKDEKGLKDATADITGNLAEYAAMAGNPNVKLEDRKTARLKMEQLLNSVGDRNKNPWKIELPDEDIRRYRNEIATLTGANDSIFASVSSPEIESWARQMARANPLGLTPGEMDAIKPYLSKEDYVSISEIKAQTIQTNANKGHKKSNNQLRTEQSFKDAVAIFKKTDPMNNLLDSWGPEKVKDARAMFYNRIDGFLEQHKGVWPDNTQRVEMMEGILEDISKSEAYSSLPPTINTDEENNAALDELDALEKQLQDEESEESQVAETERVIQETF